MFKLIDYKSHPHHSSEVLDMLRNDDRPPFDPFREPLASILGMINHPSPGYELGVLTDYDDVACGYCLYSAKEIHQFYISQACRGGKLGVQMLEFVKKLLNKEALQRFI